MSGQSGKARGFSLIEMLVAMAVLTMLMTFMFGLLGGTMRLWEQGNNQVEAAQAARVGLSRLAEDLRGAMAGVAVGATPSGGSVTNVMPFFATNGATALPSGWSSSSFSCSQGSDQIFGVRATGDRGDPYNEFGYFSAFVSDTNGFDSMRGGRYYLVRHVVRSAGKSATCDFYLRAPGSSWISSTSSGQRFPIMDNCVRIQFLYASNSGTAVTWTPTWTSGTSLPMGVLATVMAIDSRTAERIAKLNNNGQLTTAQIEAMTNNAPTTDPVSAQLRQGGVVMRRFIPFPNTQ